MCDGIGRQEIRLEYLQRQANCGMRRLSNVMAGGRRWTGGLGDRSRRSPPVGRSFIASTRREPKNRSSENEDGHERQAQRLTPEDHEDIRQLQARYSFALGFGDRAAFEACFVPDVRRLDAFAASPGFRPPK